MHEARRPGRAPGLPEGIRACLFDLDGVLTNTAAIHAAAWKDTFDKFLTERAASSGSSVVPFDAITDYDAYVDGRPREDGTRTFLASRGIELPLGTPSDPPDADTVWGVSNTKNRRFRELLHAEGVHVYPGSLRFVRAVRTAGLSRAVVSASANASAVLHAGGISDLFDQLVDAHVAKTRHLAGKPAPDTYLAAAELLGVDPTDAAVFEDALAGVAAGKAGGFGVVVGIDRVGQAAGLTEHGADVVVTDLGELLA